MYSVIIENIKWVSSTTFKNTYKYEFKKMGTIDTTKK